MNKQITGNLFHNKMIKRQIAAFFCLLSCIVMVTGCSLVRENKNFNTKDLEKQTDDFLQSWFTADFKGTIENYQAQMDDATLAIYKDYAKQKDHYKGIQKKLKTEYTITTDSATVTETILCENGEKVLASLTFNEDGSIQQDESGNYVFKFDEYKTLGQKMGKAGLNTIMCMAIVFLVLIFIAWIINGFKMIDKVTPTGSAQRGRTPSGVAVADDTTASSKSASKKDEEEDLMDDLELVAVITAAVVAATGVESSDGLVVRSIVRR